MLLTVRCFNCGEEEAQVITGGRKDVLQAKCKACGTNLLKEVLELQKEVEGRDRADTRKDLVAIGDPNEGG